MNFLLPGQFRKQFDSIKIFLKSEAWLDQEQISSIISTNPLYYLFQKTSGTNVGLSTPEFEVSLDESYFQQDF